MFPYTVKAILIKKKVFIKQTALISLQELKVFWLIEDSIVTQYVIKYYGKHSATSHCPYCNKFIV
jgi:hypothetical protein